MNRRTTRLLLTLLLAAAALMMGLITPASGAPADQDRGDATPAATSATGAPGKPAPPDASDVDRPTITPKPEPAPGSTAEPLEAWSVSRGYTPSTVRPGQSITFTAYANQDVGPTPYWISLIERATPETPTRFLAICGTGTTCSASVTHSIQVQSQVFAFISLDPRNSDPGVRPLPGEQANSGDRFDSPSWKFGPLALAAAPSTVPVGGATVLTASTDSDIGPTPYWITLFDATTGTRLAACGSGSGCSATLSQAEATTHRYLAYLSLNSTALPPAGIQVTANPGYVTWSDTGWQVSLETTELTRSRITVTARVNRDVGPTPYWITIFDGTRVVQRAVCGTGTTCQLTLTSGFNNVHYDLVTFVSANTPTGPPTNIQANSNIISADLIGNPPL